MILTARQVRAKLSSCFPDRLVVTPIVSIEQLPNGAASIDVRLGHEFKIGDRSAVGTIKPLAPDESRLRTYLREVYVETGEDFSLHPRQFALGTTLEYIRLPLDLTAQVIGRSRWARVGLVIQMASFVQPGYAGCLTLELQNLGDVPIILSPAEPVAQLLFEECYAVEKQDPAQLTCATAPDFIPLLSEEERAIISRMRSDGSSTS